MSRADRAIADWRLLHQLHDRVSDPDCPFCQRNYESKGGKT